MSCFVLEGSLERLGCVLRTRAGVLEASWGYVCVFFGVSRKFQRHQDRPRSFKTAQDVARMPREVPVTANMAKHAQRASERSERWGRSDVDVLRNSPGLFLNFYIGLQNIVGGCWGVCNICTRAYYIISCMYLYVGIYLHIFWRLLEPADQW